MKMKMKMMGMAMGMGGECVSERYILGRWQSTGMYPIIQ